MSINKIFAWISSSLLILGISLSTVQADSQLKDGYVNTYYIGAYMSVDDVKKTLIDAGFEVLGSTSIGKEKEGITSIVFTDDTLKTLANKPMRGMLAGALRVLVSEPSNKLIIHNPTYFTMAYMQSDYVKGSEQPTVERLKKAFPNLTISSDAWKGSDLEDYHFMIGMPYYHDQYVAGEGSSVDELVAKIDKKSEKSVIYKLKLSDKRYLYGVKLGNKTEKFPNKIGIDNAGVLPWQILVEEDDGDAKAKILGGKYQIAVSYPSLDLNGFMQIATTPGAIEKDVERILK